MRLSTSVTPAPPCTVTAARPLLGRLARRGAAVRLAPTARSRAASAGSRRPRASPSPSSRSTRRAAIVQLPACRSVKITRAPVDSIVSYSSCWMSSPQRPRTWIGTSTSPRPGDQLDRRDEARGEVGVSGHEARGAVGARRHSWSSRRYRLISDLSRICLISARVEPLGGVDAAPLEQVMHRDHLGDHRDVLAGIERDRDPRQRDAEDVGRLAVEPRALDLARPAATPRAAPPPRCASAGARRECRRSRGCRPGRRRESPCSGAAARGRGRSGCRCPRLRTSTRSSATRRWPRSTRSSTHSDLPMPLCPMNSSPTPYTSASEPCSVVCGANASSSQGLTRL